MSDSGIQTGQADPTHPLPRSPVACGPMPSTNHLIAATWFSPSSLKPEEPGSLTPSSPDIPTAPIHRVCGTHAAHSGLWPKNAVCSSSPSCQWEFLTHLFPVAGDFEWHLETPAAPQRWVFYTAGCLEIYYSRIYRYPGYGEYTERFRCACGHARRQLADDDGYWCAVRAHSARAIFLLHHISPRQRYRY